MRIYLILHGGIQLLLRNNGRNFVRGLCPRHAQVLDGPSRHMHPAGFARDLPGALCVVCRCPLQPPAPSLRNEPDEHDRLFHRRPLYPVSKLVKVRQNRRGVINDSSSPYFICHLFQRVLFRQRAAFVHALLVQRSLHCLLELDPLLHRSSPATHCVWFRIAGVIFCVPNPDVCTVQLHHISQLADNNRSS